MPRFVCTHNATALTQFVLPSGRTLAFDHRGALDTDEEGAAVIRAHPLYGRLILDGDESASAQGMVPVLKTPPAAVGERTEQRPAGSLMDPHGVVVECLACGKRFIQKSWTPRLYCDGACRARAYRARKGARPRLTDFERLGSRLECALKRLNPLENAPQPPSSPAARQERTSGEATPPVTPAGRAGERPDTPLGANRRSDAANGADTLEGTSEA